MELYSTQRTPDVPEDFNNDCVEFCDVCNSKQMGTELYANDAMGMATPVLWNCHRCENPPALVGLWRETKRVVKFRYNRIRYILTTTREQREARTAKIEAAKARIAARRAGVES
jgi:hypothetical protein